MTVEWKSEPTETIAAMTQMDHAIVMLPQPFVTVAQGQVEGLRSRLDLTAEWEKLDNGSQFITAGWWYARPLRRKTPRPWPPSWRNTSVYGIRQQQHPRSRAAGGAI